MFKGNNRATTVINNQTHFILHSTSIAIKSDEGIILNNGGYFSNITKKAMNEVGEIFNFKVYQKNYNWFVDYNNETLEYSNGMILK